jgi:hypothetical protein
MSPTQAAEFNVARRFYKTDNHAAIPRGQEYFPHLKQGALT